MPKYKSTFIQNLQVFSGRMDLLDDSMLEKLEREEEKNKSFNKSSQKLRLVSTNDTKTSYELLLKVKQLFQRMLPKMPREYIMQQVFDPKHSCLVLTDSENNNEDQRGEKEKIIGAVCYQPAFDREIVEIVFFAISSDCHISGYGTFLFNCLKEVCKMQYSEYLRIGKSYSKSDKLFNTLDAFTSADEAAVYVTEEYTKDKNLYLLTYADNSAIGFFKKQGFSLKPRSAKWKGYIKDYDGGTLMECKVLRDIHYLQKKKIAEKLKQRVFDKMKEVNQYHIVHPASERDIVKEHIQNQGAAPRSNSDFLKDFIFFLLCRLHSDPSSWPFHEPVNCEEVPDYRSIIKSPMDFGTMLQKYSNGEYATLNNFSSDVYLVINNCYTYNGKTTQYYKCAEAIQQLYESLIEKYSKTIKRWGFEPSK